jgi:hypothetical protein
MSAIHSAFRIPRVRGVGGLLGVGVPMSYFDPIFERMAMWRSPVVED